jgi:hypothetical protein
MSQAIKSTQDGVVDMSGCESEQSLADMAWDCAERVRNGESFDIAEYLIRCPDEAARQTFKVVVGMSALADAAFRRS